MGVQGGGAVCGEVFKTFSIWHGRSSSRKVCGFLLLVQRLTAITKEPSFGSLPIVILRGSPFDIHSLSPNPKKLSLS